MPQSYIIPALIPKSLQEIEDTISRTRAFTPHIQIDLVDGTFVPFTSWPYTEQNDVSDIKTLFEELRGIASQAEIEIDAMVQDPEQYMTTWITSGVKKIIIHIESTLRLPDIIEMDRKGIELGISLNNDTSLSKLEPHHLAHIDFIQVMGIAQIGAQGQPFDERVIERIKTLRLQYPGLPISVDGSVNTTTLPHLFEAGATRFVVGSAILNASEPRSAYEALTKIIS